MRDANVGRPGTATDPARELPALPRVIDGGGQRALFPLSGFRLLPLGFTDVNLHVHKGWHSMLNGTGVLAAGQSVVSTVTPRWTADHRVTTVIVGTVSLPMHVSLTTD